MSVLCLIANPQEPVLSNALVDAVHREVHGEINWLAQGIACEIVKPQAARPEDAAGALAAFEARRARRCAAIVAAADRNARAYHLRPPVAPLGHAVLRLAGRIAPGLALSRFAWVHGHDVTQAG